MKLDSIKIRDLIKEYPEIRLLLYYFDYKDKSSDKYQNIERVLYYCGYEIISNETEIIGKYNDIRGYMDTLVIKIGN